MYVQRNNNGTFDQEFLNTIVDHILLCLAAQLQNEKLDQFQSDDFDSDFGRSFLSLKFSKCWFRNLATAYRIGDAYCNGSKNIFTVCCQLSFRHLELQVDQFKATLFKFSHTGCITARMKDNLFHAEFKVNIKSEDILQRLDFIILEDFDEIEINVTGFGYINTIASKLATWLTICFKNRIQSAIGDKIWDYLPLKYEF